jgi:hypothetical protein
MPAAPTPQPVQPPTPPRAVIIMDAPTNAIVAGHFAKFGYSVEIIQDLRYCSTPLLKSASYIILGPNPEKSPFYEKIKSTLQKMVPDRLFEQTGTELLKALREKISENIQAPKPSHPSDQQLNNQQREAEDSEALKATSKPAPIAPPSANHKIQGLISTTLLQTSDIPLLETLGGQISKVTLEPTSFTLNDDMLRLLDPYLKVSSALGILDGQRASLLLDEELAEDASEELKKQQGGISKPLSPKRLLAKFEQLAQQAEQAKQNGKVFPPRKLPAGELYDHIITLGQFGDQLLEEKAKLRISISVAFANNICKDKLFRIFSSVGVQSEECHGTLYFYLALLALRQMKQSEFNTVFKKWQTLNAQRSESQKKSGLGGLFKKKNETTEEEPVSPEWTETSLALSQLIGLINVIDSELPSYEKDLCDAFWTVYEDCCQLILQNKVKNASFLRYIRAFLRFGLMSDHPAVASKAQSQFLLNISDEDNSSFQHEANKTNIIFTDEALVQIREGIIPPSFDEELELEGQGTPKYKYDKSIRKIYASKFKILVYGREKAHWQKKVLEQEEAQKAADTMLAEQEKGSKEYKVILNAVREARSEISRVSKIVEKIESVIESENETIANQNEILTQLNYTPILKEIAANETKTIRSMCKLLGNRKENFLPFILRDNFKPEQNNLHDRNTMATTLANFEKDDPTIFSIDLANTPNPRKQVMIRFSPTLIIYPVMGNMGFCVSPSGTSDTGRVILPVMGNNQVALPRMMVDMFADFRYDTAKETAGVDLMTSDTICAAYAKVRWDYRKKGKEFREKAGIYNDLQDKKNFVLHYRLYIESMEESGKKLFFKCHEMYEGFVKYIPLPQGKTKLSKN